MKNAEKIILSIGRSFSENDYIDYEPYIRYIRFPRYKLLSKNTKIDFSFPFTALVGENGCNKTSVLQALYGTKDGNSVGTYWFNTDVDKINDSGHPNCLIYGYKNLKINKIVETLKTRVNSKSKNPDYWEPSRPIAAYNMKMPSKKALERAENKSTTRWDQIKKNVVYSDCKEYKVQHKS